MKKQMAKILSIVLSIAVVLSVCGILGVFNATATNNDLTGTVREYFVKGDEGVNYSASDKYGEVGTETNPYASIYDVVQAVNADAAFDVEGNTFKVWIMQDFASLIANKDKTYKVGSVTYITHNMAYWAQVGTSNIIGKHNAKMVIDAHKDNVIDATGATAPKYTYLATSCLVGTNVALTFGGPTELYNVNIAFMSSSNATNANTTKVVFAGNSVKIDSTVTGSYTPSINSNSSANWNATLTNVEAFAMDIGQATTATYLKPVEITILNNIDGDRQRFFIPSLAKGAQVFKENVTLNLLSSSVDKGRLSISTSNHATLPIFEKDINVKITGAGGAWQFNPNGGQAIVKGGIHLIKSKSATNRGASYPWSQIYSTAYTEYTDAENNTPISKHWIVTADDANVNLIDFYGETGKFAIAKGYKATATNTATNAVAYSIDGVLNLNESGSGEYTVTFEEQAEKVYDYYVQFGGTGNGTDENNPAPDVATAIATMERLGLTAEETATIYVKQTITKPALSGAANSYNGNCTPHNLAAWGNVGSHKAKVIVTAHEDNKQFFNNDVRDTYIATSPAVGHNNTLLLGGDVEFRNITILYAYGPSESNVTNRDAINANGKNLTFGEGTKFAYIPRSTANDDSWTGNINDYDGLLNTSLGKAGQVYDKPFKITVNRHFKTYNGSRFHIPNYIAGTYNFAEDVTYEVNGDTNLTGFAFAHQAGTTATFEKNLNLKFTYCVRDDESYNTIRIFNGAGSVVVKGGMQVINCGKGFITNGGAVDSWDALTTVVDENGSTNNKWILNVSQADVDKVNFISGVTGKFTAVKEGYTAIAYNADKSVVETADENGVINLEGKPGTYTVEFTEKIVHVENHDLDAYINYRGYNTAVTKNNGALANASKKLATESEINVVYFGGSVTVGAGSTNNGSWRGRISDWLTKSFPTVKVNNYNQAIGETGTYLGCYRVARDIVSKAPDILFIEYSINDHYDRATRERTSSQFETIVRNVKEAYPDCDIVTVLVTDVNCADEAAKGNLHPQAEVHEEISAYYNIPTLHVGRYLATTLKAEGCTFENSADAVWAKYFDDAEGGHDIVHPNNKGYDLYYQVVNAFMTNCLVFGDNSNYAVQDQVLPETINKYLFDGEVTYIDESDVAFTTEGGTTLSPDMQGIVYPDYQGLIRVPAGSQDVITVEFNGTELIMLSKSGHGKKAGNNYSVRIDGGEWVEYAYQGKNPIVIASGLVGGDHVAEIKVSPATDVFGNGTDYRISGFYSRNAEKATNRLSILDLVAIDETIDDTSLDYRDFNNDHVININDIATLKMILLNNR